MVSGEMTGRLTSAGMAKVGLIIGIAATVPELTGIGVTCCRVGILCGNGWEMYFITVERNEARRMEKFSAWVKRWTLSVSQGKL